MSWIVSLITSLLGMFLKHKQDVSEEAGENIQAMKDQGAAYAQVQTDVTTASAVDQHIVQSAPGSNSVVPAADLANDPDLPQR